MKLLYKYKWDKEWHLTDLKKLKSILANAGPVARFEVRKPCDHKKTFIDDGIKYCETCGDMIEVTSYRD